MYQQQWDYQAMPWFQQQQQMPGLPYQTQPGQQFLPGTPMPVPPGFTGQQPQQQQPGMLPLEQSYIENILRLNRGKVGTFYLTFENNQQWNAKVIKGVVEEAGRDHIIVADPQSGKHYLLLMVYLDYVTFDEPLEYEYPFGSPMATYAPR